MNEREVAMRSDHDETVVLIRESSMGVMTSFVVHDESLREDVKVFHSDEAQDAIAFTDGYAYRKSIEETRQERGKLGKIWASITQFLP